jgi:hypothetical protein
VNAAGGVGGYAMGKQSEPAGAGARGRRVGAASGVVQNGRDTPPTHRASVAVEG